MRRGKVENLPKWARAEIERLERDLESASARLAAGPENSDTFADPYMAAKRPLGRGTRIEFRAGDAWNQKFLVYLDREQLVVSGGDGLLIQPRAGNSINVRIGR